MSKLTSLALTACSINDEEIQALCVGLAQCHVIMYVNFENNEISSDGLQSFVTLAAECRTLKSVCVYGNEEASDMAYRETQRALERHNVEFFWDGEDSE